MIQEQCGDCRHLPPYVERVPYDHAISAPVEREQISEEILKNPEPQEESDMAAIKFKNDSEAKEILGDKYPEGEKPMTEEKKDYNMGLEKPKCIYCKEKPQHARELCSSCWYLWRQGRIEHPKLGVWKPADPNHLKINQSKESKTMVKNKTKESEIMTGPPPEKADSLTKMDLMQMLRSRLEECQALGITLGIFGMYDKVHAEIHKQLSPWVDE
jgi:hypothetical protein